LFVLKVVPMVVPKFGVVGVVSEKENTFILSDQ
jgi:hypothetical protein